MSSRVLIVAMMFMMSGCSYRRVVYPTIADANAPSWVCVQSPDDPNTHVCWDAAKVFQQTVEEAKKRRQL